MKTNTWHSSLLLQIILGIIVAVSSLTAQVGIGTTSPNPASILDVSSTTQGVLLPRMTTAQRNAIENPPEGLLVFDTDTKSPWFAESDSWDQMVPNSAKSRGSGELIVTYTDTHGYGFYEDFFTGEGFWIAKTFAEPPIRVESSEYGIVVLTPEHAYGYYDSIGVRKWVTTSLSGESIDMISSLFSVVVFTTTHAYAFNQDYSYANGPNWSDVLLSGTPQGAVASRNNVVVYTDTHAYGYYFNNNGNGAWASLLLDGPVIGSAISGLNVVIYTSEKAYGFTTKGDWTPRTFQGLPIGAIGTK